MKIVTRKCHVEKYTEGQYDMIIILDLLKQLGTYLKISNNTKEYGKRDVHGIHRVHVGLKRI